MTGAAQWRFAGPIGARTRPTPAPAASHTLPRLLVRDVARDHFVHGLPRVPDAFLAHREIDGRHALVGGHLLDFLARHVTHEARRPAVEPRRRVLRPRD